MTINLKLNKYNKCPFHTPTMILLLSLTESSSIALLALCRLPRLSKQAAFTDVLSLGPPKRFRRGGGGASESLRIINAPIAPCTVRGIRQLYILTLLAPEVRHYPCQYCFLLL